MKKLRIGVLMGGKSEEREVSLNSGRTICDHLDNNRYNIIPIFQKRDNTLYFMPRHFLHRGKISDFEHRLDKEAKKINWDNLKEKIDFLYIAQHGQFAEDGRLQGMLEVLKIPYFGSKVLANAIGLNKTVQKVFLKKAGIKTPKSITIYPEQLKNLNYKKLSQDIKFPVIIKPNQEGSSLGITLLKNSSNLKEALEKAASITPGAKQPVLIEEYIEGMEFSCIVITDYKNNKPIPLPPTEIETPPLSFFNYEQKYMPGQLLKHTPARCSQEEIKLIQDTCIKTAQALDILTIARIDGFLTKNKEIIIIDPNTLSGMTPSSFTFLQAAEINMSNTQLINHLIETELYKYKMQGDFVKEFFEQKITTQKNDTRLRVGVFMGGASNEKEISLASGRNIFYKLSPQKYKGIPIFVNKNLELYKINQRLLVRNKTDEIEADLDPKNKILWSKLKNHIDFAFLGLHGGEGENGSIQGALETLEIPYNGSSVLASALCMDKFKTNQFLEEHDIPVPKSILINKEQWNSKNIPQLIYPQIIKPNDDGCSILVQKANNEQELFDAIEKIFATEKKYALIEEFIKGIELTVGVLGNQNPQVLPPSMAVASKEILSIEEKFLPGAGENQTPAPISPKATKLVQETVKKTYEKIGCKGYARIDCFYQPKSISPTKEDRVVILEINTVPGMTPATCIFHQAAEIGLSPMEFIDKIIQYGLEEHTHQNIHHKTIIKENPKKTK